MKILGTTTVCIVVFLILSLVSPKRLVMAFFSPRYDAGSIIIQRHRFVSSAPASKRIGMAGSPDNKYPQATIDKLEGLNAQGQLSKLLSTILKRTLKKLRVALAKRLAMEDTALKEGTQRKAEYVDDLISGSRAGDASRIGATVDKSKAKPKSAPVPTRKLDLTLVLIDHYDSFTYNLYDMLAQICTRPPIVLAKDAFDNWNAVLKEYGSDIDGIILSPGPGTPTHPDDIGTLSPSAIQENPTLPILGVCLGHQILGHVYGAEVYLCGPVHGQVRTIQQQEQQLKMEEDPLWRGIPSQLNVTRYHSLAVRFNASDNAAASIPLRATAHTVREDEYGAGDILMGLSHTEYPHYGVQFHPESLLTPDGLRVIENWVSS